MKIQDIIFIIILIFLIFKKDARLPAWVGIACLVVTIPLFANWTFFTAERLTWYATAFFLLSIILCLRDIRKRS